MRDASAAIVADELESREAERLHHLDLVLRRLALRVRDVALTAVGLRRIAIAAQIAADDGVPFHEPWCNSMPHRVRLRITVQEEERRTTPAHFAVDSRTGGRNMARRESGSGTTPCCSSAFKYDLPSLTDRPCLADRPEPARNRCPHVRLPAATPAS